MTRGSCCAAARGLGRCALAEDDVDATVRPGRNDPCRCGSGKKYKKCCQAADDAHDAQARREEEAARKPPLDLGRGHHQGCTDPTHRH